MGRRGRLAPRRRRASRSVDLARTKQRYITEEEELRRWREGLDVALRKRRRSLGRRILRGLVFFLVLAVAAAGGGAAYFWQQVNSRITRTDVDLPQATGPAMNILVIGSDSRDGTRSPEDVKKFGRVDGQRSDTIILVQVVPAERRAVLLHFPRDLWVPIAGGPPGKINSAYNEGPQTLVDTIQMLTGAPINHYVEVDINGFRNMVDALGGIDVCLDRQMNDRVLNFRLPAGPNHLDGEIALSFVRSRAATADGDFGRIRRQQQFLRAVVEKVSTVGVLANPLRLNSLATSFASNVTTDQRLSIWEMLPLARNVQTVSPEQMQTYTVPGDVSTRSGQSVVIMDEAPAEVLFAALRDVADPAERMRPAPVEISVEDASGAGIGATVAGQLSDRGFIVVSESLAARRQSTTQIVTPRLRANDAKRLQAVIPGAPILYGGDGIRIIIGSTFKGLAPEPKGEAPATEGPCANWRQQTEAL